MLGASFVTFDWMKQNGLPFRTLPFKLLSGSNLKKIRHDLTQDSSPQEDL